METQATGLQKNVLVNWANLLQLYPAFSTFLWPCSTITWAIDTCSKSFVVTADTSLSLTSRSMLLPTANSSYAAASSLFSACSLSFCCLALASGAFISPKPMAQFLPPPIPIPCPFPLHFLSFPFPFSSPLLSLSSPLPSSPPVRCLPLSALVPSPSSGGFGGPPSERFWFLHYCRRVLSHFLTKKWGLWFRVSL